MRCVVLCGSSLLDYYWIRFIARHLMVCGFVGVLEGNGV